MSLPQWQGDDGIAEAIAGVITKNYIRTKIEALILLK